MFDVQCLQSASGGFTVSASLIIKRPCHFGVVSYKVSAQPQAAEATSLIEKEAIVSHENLTPLMPDTRHLKPETFTFLKHVVDKNR